MDLLKNLDKRWSQERDQQQEQRTKEQAELERLARVWVTKSKDMRGVCDPLRSKGGKKNV